MLNATNLSMAFWRSFVTVSVSIGARFLLWAGPALSAIRYVAEFILSVTRFFASLRTTRSEMVAMTRSQGASATESQAARVTGGEG